MLALALLLVACRDNPQPADTDTAPTYDEDGCLHVAWDPTQAVPFPSNHLVVRDDTSATGVRLQLDEAAVPVATSGSPAVDVSGLSGQDGFSRLAQSVLPLTIAVDADDLAGVDPSADGSPVFLLDVEAQARVPARLSVTEDGGTIVLAPLAPYAEGRLYATVALATLPSDTCVSMAPELRRATDADDALGDELRAARAAAAAVGGVSEDEVVAAIPFRTRSRAGEVATLAAIADLLPTEVSADDVAWDTVVDCAIDTLEGYCGDGVAFAAVGTATLPTWQADDGRFVVDDAGVPAVQGDEAVPFWLLVPEAGRSGAVPVVVVQHGLGGDKEDMRELGREFVARGYAAAAIDAVRHGERPHQGDATTAFFAAKSEQWDVAEVRDNLRQTASDHRALLEALRQNPDGTAFSGGAFHLDLDRTYYFGQSLGGIIGATSCALDGAYDACVLNVPGGRLVDIVRLNSRYSLLMYVYFTVDEQREIELFTALGQSIVDPADPAVTGARIFTDPFDGAPRPVLVQEATDDSTVDNLTTELLARAMSLPLLEPAVEDIDHIERQTMPVTDNCPTTTGGAVTCGLTQFDASHGFVTSGDSEAARALVQTFTMWETGSILEGE